MLRHLRTPHGFLSVFSVTLWLVSSCRPRFALRAPCHFLRRLSRLSPGRDAEEHLQTSVQLDPEQYMAHTSLGELLAKQEKLTEARSHFEQALKIAPDYAPARKNLAAMSAASVK